MNQDTQKMLQQLADKLGVTVQYLWAALIKGNRVEGAILFGFVGLGVVMGVVSFFFLRTAFRKAKESKYDEDEPYFWAGTISAIASAILILCFSYWAIMDTFCPEYGALSDILGHVK